MKGTRQTQNFKEQVEMGFRSEIVSGNTLDSTKARRLVFWIIGVALAIKVILAWFLPLGVDETYAVSVARGYSLSFFDHPPVSFWLPVASADLFGIDHRMVYRLPVLLMGAGTNWIMYRIGTMIGGERVGVLTALLFAAAIFPGAVAGVFAAPDGPINFFSALCVLFLLKNLERGPAGTPLLWIGTGLALAFAMASKYQAAWIPAAVLIFALVSPNGRRWLVLPWPWVGVVLGLLGWAPVILWNEHTDWASFRFHTGRAGGGFDLGNYLSMIAGQALFLLPATLYAAIIGIASAFRSPRSDARLLLAIMALGPIVFFNVIYFFSDSTLSHWTMPGWLFALPLAAWWIERRGAVMLRRIWRWTLVSLAVVWVPSVTWLVQANTGFLTNAFYESPPAWDNTIDIYDYSVIRSKLIERGLWDETQVLSTWNWSFAGNIGEAMGRERPIWPLDPTDRHHFVFLPGATATGQALFFERSHLATLEEVEKTALAQVRAVDPNAELLEPLMLQRGGRDYVAIVLIRFTLTDH